MGYHETSIKRIEALIGEIQGRKAHAYAATTYRDTPALRELVAMAEEQLAKERDRDTLEDSILIFRFVAESYDSMGRFALSARLYHTVLSLAVELKDTYGEDTPDVADLYYAALAARNFYVDDDCDDLAMLAERLMPFEKARKMLCERQARRRSLKHDSVEMSEAYLAVVDAVEERLEKNCTLHGRGSCHEAWRLRREYLAEYGIEWHSVGELNPSVHFD